MEFEDKEDFVRKLSKAMRKVGRKIDAEDAAAFFEDLQEYPRDIVFKGIDRANRDRDYDDVYQRNKMLETAEIRKAIEKVLASPGTKRSGCDKCEGTTWILPEPLPPGVKKKVKYTEPARRCECWLGAIESKKNEPDQKEKAKNK